jgi:iron(III) transport system substrate-binding protein
MLHRRSLRSMSILACALALAACGASPTASKDTSQTTKLEKHSVSVYQKFNSMSGGQRQQELVKAAEGEGELSVYTSNTDIDSLIDAFEDTYDIDVSVYRGDSESVLQRVLQESKAHFYGNDVLETNQLELDITNKEGLLSPYQSDLRDQVRPEAASDTWVGDRLNVFVVSYNTDRVKPQELPDSIVGFADPKWKGRISMELEDIDWFAAMHQYLMSSQGMSDQEATDVFRKIAANAKIVKGHTTQAELLAAGQFDVALSTYSHSVDELDQEGAPITWHPPGREPVQPVVTRPDGVGLMKTATNPAAALLFTEFALRQGQKIFAKDYRIGAIETGKDPLVGLKAIEVPGDEVLAHNTKWSNLYEHVVQGGDLVKTEE